LPRRCRLFCGIFESPSNAVELEPAGAPRLLEEARSLPAEKCGESTRTPSKRK